MTAYERGVALSGMENRSSTLPGKANTDYLVPREKDFAYFSSKGFTLIRLAITWERMQPSLFGPLDPAFKKHVDACIELAKKYNMRILLEPHNYGGRRVNGVGYKIGTPQVTVEAFADFWGKVAMAYSDEEGIYGYDLMNEPHTMPVGCTPLTYHPSKFDYITNPRFEDGKSGWSMDSVFKIGDQCAEFDITGGWANLTSYNAKGGGIPVVPGATVTIEFDYELEITSGNGPRFRISYGDNAAYGTEISGTGKTLGKTVGKATHKVTFTVPDKADMVWLRFQNQGGNVKGKVSNFRYSASSLPKRQVATTTLMNQAAIDAIRAVDLKHWIVLEFDRYTGLASFGANFGTNPEVWWSDPVNKTMPSFHYYQDSDYSGSYTKAWTQGLRDRMEAQVRLVFDWAKRNKVTVFMGEYGVPNTEDSSGENYRQDLDAFLTLMDEYAIPGTYWSAGWGYTSPTTIHPTENYTVDRKVLATVLKHLGKKDTPPTPQPIPYDPETDPALWKVDDLVRLSFGASYKRPEANANAFVFECKNVKVGDVLSPNLKCTQGQLIGARLSMASISLPYRNFASGKNGPNDRHLPPHALGEETREFWYGKGSVPMIFRLDNVPPGVYEVVVGGAAPSTGVSDLFKATVSFPAGKGTGGVYDADGAKPAGSDQWYFISSDVEPVNGILDVSVVAAVAGGQACVSFITLRRLSAPVQYETYLRELAA
ncbi:hypothetical protein LUCX_247 [Xanthomonas phage vB_XciM_LucasX]|nr:hypothetical protein LUCX_247 [Xanthomonas phage vB_XciM_LucasX]